MKKKILLSLLILLLAGGLFTAGYSYGKQNSDSIKDNSNEINEYYLSMYKNLFNLEDCVYVIGHSNPDTDTVSSAIAMANLLNQIGVEAKPVIADELNKETKEILSILDIEEPAVLENASGLNLFLVDHNAMSQAVKGIEEANIVGIIDHHNISDVTSADVVYGSFAPVGSTSMLIYSKYKELNIDVDEKMAALICSGLMSDTNNMKYDTATEFDKQLFDELWSKTNLDHDEFNTRRLKAKINYEGMSAKDLLFYDYKNYDMGDKKVGIGCLDSIGEEDSIELINKMIPALKQNHEESGVDYLYLMIHDYLTDYQYILCVDEPSKQICQKALDKTFDEYLILEHSIARKSGFVPALIKTIEGK